VRCRFGLLVAWIFLSAAHPAAAQTRVALIIANSDYVNPNLKLTNPANDAAAMQRALHDAGFETIVKLNATRREFYRAIDEFGAKIGRDQHSVGLFYYAGHGVQADGTNFLIPVDADIQAESDLEPNAFDAGRVLRAMKAAQNEMNIVILDACRDNPLPKTRGIERGLARMDAPSGTFIAYAAAPGQSAQDGASGTNGVFTGELVKAMAEQGVPLEEMFKKVIAGVKADTHGGQQPWSEASIQGDFYFHAATSGQAPAPAQVSSPAAQSGTSRASTADEMAAFKAAESSNTVPGWQIFKRNYPNSPYTATADIRLATLTQPQAQAPASAQVPVPTPFRPPSQSANPAIDPLIVGTFEFHNVVDDYDQQFVYTITADGTYHLLVTQEEKGSYQAVNGNFRTVADKTRRVRTGTYRALGTDAIEMTGAHGSSVFQPTQPAPPINPVNPVILGTWHGSTNQSGVVWQLTLQISPNGRYEYKAQTEDSGSCAYANHQWHAASALTGLTDTGTYRMIDARSVEFTGLRGSGVWMRR
jgi:uncharacterized caspase-like protein